MHFWKSAKQALWVKIQLYKLAKKKTGIGEYKYAHIFYILIGIFPFTEELNSIDTTSETAYILLWFLRTPRRQEEECFVYNFSGLSNLVASGPTTMMVIQERDFWEKKKCTVRGLLCLLLLGCSEQATEKEKKLLEDCFAVPLLQRRMTKWLISAVFWGLLQQCSSEAAGCGWRIFCRKEA